MSPTYKIHIRDEETGGLLMSQVMNWKPCAGTAVKKFRGGPHIVTRCVQHKIYDNLWTVWIKKERK
jgi:hypothetical protein